jgi:hypothetical protein
LHSYFFSTCVVFVSTGFACAEPRSESSQGTAGDTLVPGQRSSQAAGHCYRSSHSALLGPRTQSRQNGQGPGWLRVEGLPVADSGAAELVDANRAGLGGFWRRGPTDSISITVADDFLRVDLRLAVSETAATGSALAVSDADLERDALGKLRSFRRGWVFRAPRAPCDSMPVRSTYSAP